MDIEPVSNDVGGFDVAWTKAGEWLEYTIDVADSGSYDMAFRIASPIDGAKFHAEIDGFNVTGVLTATNTGGAQSWRTLVKTGVSIGAGQHILRLYIDSATGPSFNYISLYATGTQPPPPPTPIQTPYPGTAPAISQSGPTTIQVENFDNGGEGIAYHDSDTANQGGAYRSTGVDIEATADAGGGYDVGWTRAGEWLEYTINVVDAGSYDLGFRVASPVSGAAFHAEIDGTDVTGPLSIPATGGFQSWTTITKTGVALTAGQHVLRLSLDQTASNFSVGNYNYITVAPTGTQPPPPLPGQTPFGGTPVAIGSSGAATIEAENFDNGGEGVAYHDTDTTNQGGKYRSTGVDIESVSNDTGAYDVGWTKPGEWLEYSINVTDAGTYNLGFRVASLGSNGTFHAEIDGTDVTGPLTIPNTGGWQNWTTVTKPGITLAAGPHVLKIVMDSAGTAGVIGNFNYITATPDTAPPPPPPGQTPFGGTPVAITGSATATIQAENFDNGGEGVAYHDTDTTNQGGKYRSTGVDIESTGDTGGGYDVGYTKAGEWLEYTINVTDAGSYDLGFRVASASASGVFHAEIDGANVTGSLAVPNTGGWQTWQTVTDTGISLTAGQHVLKLSMDANGSSGYVGNFNYITVGPSSSVQPPPPPPTQSPYGGTPFAVASSGTSTLQAENFDNGGEGVAYHDTDAVNSGNQYRNTGVDIETVSNDTGSYDVGWTQAGEWLEYTINVATAGNYDLGFRVASTGSNGTFHAEIDGANVTGAMTVPNTGGWQNWTTVTRSGVALSAGQHVLKLSMDAAGTNGVVGNFNYITFAPSIPTPQPTTITSTVATYVQDGTYANTNFGSASTLLVKNYTSTGTNRESYLRFDLSGVSSIKSAMLRLYGHLSADNGPVQVGIYSSSNTTWSENTLTWNTRFASASSPVATLTVNSTTAGAYEVDLTSFLKAEKSLGDNTVTIVLKGTTSATPIAIFNSDDASSNQPQLIIT